MYIYVCVFRVCAGALTDHKSILLNVTGRGEIEKGTTNEDWYNLGVAKSSKFWRDLFTKATPTGWTTHPDDPSITLTGQRVPDFDRWA